GGARPHPRRGGAQRGRPAHRAGPAGPPRGGWDGDAARGGLRRLPAAGPDVLAHGRVVAVSGGGAMRRWLPWFVVPACAPGDGPDVPVPEGPLMVMATASDRYDAGAMAVASLDG